MFCSDVTFDASINPVAYEDGEAVFIDTEQDTWNIWQLSLLTNLEEFYYGRRRGVLAFEDEIERTRRSAS